RLIFALVTFTFSGILHAQSNCTLPREIASVETSTAPVVAGSMDAADVITYTVTLAPEPCPADPQNPSAPSHSYRINSDFSFDIVEPIGDWYTTRASCGFNSIGLRRR